MKVIIGGRGTGRTTELVKRSAKTNYPIVVASSSTANYVKKIGSELGLQIPEPIVYKSSDCLRGMDGKILIDNADMLLRKILGIDIDTYTVCTNDEELMEL